MSKGKKRNFNKPVLPVKKHGIKMPPAELPKLRKPKAVGWDRSAIQELWEGMPKPRQGGFTWGGTTTPVFTQEYTENQPGEGFWKLGDSPEEHNVIVDPVTGEVRPDIKRKPTEDWAEEWYEKNR